MAQGIQGEGAALSLRPEYHIESALGFTIKEMHPHIQGSLYRLLTMRIRYSALAINAESEKNKQIAIEGIKYINQRIAEMLHLHF